MTLTPGKARLSSTTARPAEKGAREAEVDPAVLRRTIGAVVTVTGCRRSEARERVDAWLSGGEPLADLEAYLRATFRADPVGVTAVRNVSRGGGRG